MKNQLQNSRLAGGKFIPMKPEARLRGFTLVEMLVATFVLVIILTMTLQITNYANTLFLNSRKRIDTFQEARAGFEVMTRTISQAMLDTYWDYANGAVGSGTGSPRPSPDSTYSSNSYVSASGTWQPTQYLRNSALHFVCGQSTVTSTGIANTITGTSAATTTSPVTNMVGHSIFFQAPLGYSDNTTNAVMPSQLNSCGFYLQFGSDNPDRPAFLTGQETGVSTTGADPLPVKFRFRLKEFVLPSEYMYVYQYVNQYATVPTYLVPSFTNWWFSLPLVKKNNNAGALPVNPNFTLAQNVIALVIEPMRSPNYTVPITAPVELAPQYYYDTRAWASTTSSVATSPQAIASRNQLPPQVMVTMVAIDEPSAARLQAQYGGVNGSTLPVTANSACFSDANTPTPALTGGLYNNKGVAQIFLNASVPAGSQVSNPPPNPPSQGSINYIYYGDLANLEQALVNLHITYRVFTTNVTILQAKFSD